MKTGLPDFTSETSFSVTPVYRICHDAAELSKKKLIRQIFKDDYKDSLL